MSTASKLVTICCFFLLLVGLGLTDAYLTHDVIRLPTTEASTDGESDPTGTTKEEGPNVLEVLTQKGFTMTETHEVGKLSLVVPPDTKLQASVLLKDNDRVSYMAYTDSPNVKAYFLALKNALHQSFSAGLKDLRDETQEREGHPIRNILTFQDPAISPERLLFVRVRQRLYEFHIVEGKNEMVDELVEALTD